MAKSKFIELRVLECVKDPVTFIEDAAISNITYVECVDGKNNTCKELLAQPSEVLPPPGLIAFDVYHRVDNKLVLLADLIFNTTFGTYVIEKYATGMTHLKLVFKVEYSPK